VGAEIQTLFPWIAAVLGLAVGSFLNVVIHRLPRMLQAEWKAQCAELEGRAAPEEPRYNLWAPRSQCPACGRSLHVAHNLPVVSYLALRGRCAFCRSPISVRYPVVEASTALLFAWVAAHFGYSAAGAGALILTAFLLALAAIDADTTLLPDDLTQPLLWIGPVDEPGLDLRTAAGGRDRRRGWLSVPVVGVLGVQAGHRQGRHGLRDFKLLAALGAWLG